MASELGIVVPPEAQPVVPRAEAPKPRAQEPVAEPPMLFAPPEKQWPVGPPPEPQAEPWGLLDAAEEAAPALEPSDSWEARPRRSAEGDDQRRSGRRGRRRRRPDRPEGGDRPAVEFREPAEPDEDDTELEEEPAHEDASQETPIGAPRSDAPDDAGARPKRRRRRRKRSSRERGEALEAGSPEPSEALVGAPAEIPQAAQDGALEEDFDADAENDALDDETESDLGGPIVHRGVPTWKDTVDILITANMESRSRRPDRGPPNRHRGNRNRGGRDR